MKGPDMPDVWPADELENVSNCPVCKSERRSVLHTDLMDHVFYCAPGTWCLYQCEGCEAAYLDPRPSASSIHKAYARYYTHQATPSDQYPPLSLTDKIKRAARNSYLNSRYGYHLPSLPLGHLLLNMSATLRNYADREVRCLPLTRAGRMLDVGCGNGAFLAQMRDYGWNVVGLDFDPNAVAAARTIGIEATCGALEMSTYPPESFDAVCLNHVIEHLYNPVETLHICRQILKPGGYLYVATPNIKSAGHARHQQFWRGLEPPRHLTLFSPDALTHAFELAGFNDLRLSAIPDSVKFYLQSTAIAQGKDPYTQMSIEPEIAQQLALEDKQCIDNPKLSNNIALIGRKA